MPGTSLPSDDPQRCPRLDPCNDLDSENEQIFHDFTRLAARLCNTPMALIRLANGNHQQFKSAFGLDPKEIPRDSTICAQVLLNDEPLVISDAPNDPRTFDDPLVTGPPHIGFFMGVKLQSEDGVALGVLCVIDTTSRKLANDQLDNLILLARQASRLLDLKRANNSLNQKRLDLVDSRERIAQISAQLPGVVYQYLRRPDGTSSFPFASEGIRDIYRVSPEEVQFDAQPVLDLLHPEDRDQVLASIERSARKLEHWKHEYRVLFPDGSTRWLSGNATPTLLPDRSVLWHGFITDITQQKQERDEAQRIRSQLEAVIDSSTQIAIIATDLKGVITVFNPGAEQMLGYSAAEMVGLETPKRIHLESEVIARGQQLTRETGRPVQEFDVFVEYARQGRHDSREWTYIRKDGSKLTVELVVTAIRDAENTLTGFLAVASDVTASRNIESELRSERERLELALTGGDLGIWDWNVERRMMILDSRGMDIIGEPSRQLLLTLDDWESRVHPEDLPQLRRLVEDHFAERTDILEAKYRLRRTDGTRIWVVLRGRVVERTDSGQPVRMAGTLADVTAQVQAEQISQEGESRFRALAASAPIGIFKTDPSGHYIYTNECWQLMWGLCSEEEVADCWIQVVHPQDRERVSQAWKQVVDGRAVFEEEFRCVSGNDAIRYMRMKARPVFSESQDCIGFVGCSEDITTAYEAEKVIREQNDWFRQLTGSLPQLTWTCLPDGPCDYLSRQWVEYTGIPEEEQLPYGWLDQLHPDDRASTIQLWRKHVESGEPFETQFRIRSAEGAYRWFQTRAVPIRDADGTIVKWLGSNTDIQSIRVSEERYEIAVRGSGAGLWDWDISSMSVFYSPRFRDMLGYTAEEFPDHFDSFFNKLHPEDCQLVQEALDVHFANPEIPYAIELRLQTKFREYRTFLANGAALRDQMGKPYRMAGSIVDVTDRVRAEQELKATAELLRQFIRHTPAAVAILDRDLRYLQASERWLQDYGLGDTELIGKSHYEIFPEIPDRWKEIYQCALAGATLACNEDRFVRSNGKEDWLQWEIRPWRNSKEEVGGLIFFTQLITQRKLAERELIAARETADTANRSKSDFLANMSHEIRTPLTAILGYVELLRDRNVSDDVYDSHLMTIARSGEHLLRLINDILDLSKIEAGRMTVERIPVSPADVIQEVLGYFQEMAANKNLGLTAKVMGRIPKTICSDPVRLRQILVNLVGNAIKFTEEGRVQVVVRLVDSNDHPSRQVAFDVHDTGIGLSEEQQKALFQPFIQADSSTTRKFGGTGLGLTVSRRMARLLDGDVSVESTLGQGSRFTATVDAGAIDGVEWIDSLEVVAEQSLSSSAPIKLSGRILLAEDSPLNQQLLKTFLTKAGATVDVVDDGRQAIRKVLGKTDNSDGTVPVPESSPSYDLILMDMQMPEMDGCSATKVLRSEGFSGPIVALTANAMREDREKCLAAGCDDFLTKPIEKSRLLTSSQEWISRGKARKDTSLHPDEKSNSSNIFDQEAMHELVDGDVELLTQIISLFQKDTSQLMQQAGKAIQENNWKSLTQSAHRMKGICAAVHAKSACEAAHRLEELGANNDLEAVQSQLVELAREVEQLTPLMDELIPRQKS